MGVSDDSDSVIGQFLQVRDHLQQMWTRLINNPIWVIWVGSVEGIQNFQRAEKLKVLQMQEVLVQYTMMSDPQRPQLWEQLWEESDEAGGRPPGLQM